MLRAVYRWSVDHPERRLREQAASVIEIDVADLDDASLERRVRACHLAPFDLATGPVFRVHLFRRSDTAHLLLCVASHAVADGVSMSTILDDLRRAYEAAVTGVEIHRPPLRHTYDDFVASQRSGEGQAAQDRDWEYWRTVLRDGPPVRRHS